MKLLITITAICAAFAVVAIAGPDGADGAKGKGGKAGKGGKRPSPEQVFKKLDADQSGGISLEEYQNGPMAKRAKDPAMVEERFNRVAGDDGIISQKELAAAFKKMAGRGRPGGKGGKKGAPTS